MSLSISSAKPDGIEPLISSDNYRLRPVNIRHTLPVYGFRMIFSAVFLLFTLQPVVLKASPDIESPAISQKAAEECKRKFKEVEDFAGSPATGTEKTTRFTEEEINSYMALETESKYGSCLKNFRTSFKDNLMESIASVDFDCLKQKSSKGIPGLIKRLFSGIHVITARGSFAEGEEQGGFRLEEARLDDGTLPRYLIERMISAICMQQEPPFDPMEPSTLPYNIKRVTIHPGYIMVFQ